MFSLIIGIFGLCKIDACDLDDFRKDLFFMFVGEFAGILSAFLILKYFY